MFHYGFWRQLFLINLLVDSLSLVVHVFCVRSETCDRCWFNTTSISWAHTFCDRDYCCNNVCCGMGMPMPPSLIGSEKRSLSSSVMVCLPETAGMNWWRITSSNGFNWLLDRGTVLMKNIHPHMTPCEKAEKAACGWDFANSAKFPTWPHHSWTLS